MLSRIEEWVHKIDRILRVLGGDVAGSLHVLLLRWLADFWREASSSLGTVSFRGVTGPSRDAVAAEVASAMGVS